MQMNKYKELILGVIILLLAVVYGISTTQIKLRVAMSFTARYVPYILSALCFTLGVFQTGRGLRILREYNQSGGEEEQIDRKSVLLVFLTLVLYTALLRTVGFLINTAVLTFMLMFLLCPKSKRKPAVFAVIAVVSTIAVYFLFRNGLNLMLPKGILF